MKILNVFLPLFLTGIITARAFAAQENVSSQTPTTDPTVASSMAPTTDLSKFIYSYGAVLKVSATEIVLQEYDYDSDVEKEVSYQIDPSIKCEGFKAVSDLAAEDVVEIYYLEQDGKKTAKIIRREIVEEENSSPENT